MTHDNDMSDPTPLSDDQLDHAGRLLRGALPPVAFASGFADRTMARVAASRTAPQPAATRVMAMQHNFRLLTAAAALAIVALGVHNTYVSRIDNTSFVEAAIGLQPVSAESILAASNDDPGSESAEQ